MEHDSLAGIIGKACILILVFLHAPQVYAAEDVSGLSATVTIANGTNAVITDFSINPKHINVDQPQDIEFWMTVENIGSIDINATPYVNITNASGSIADITYTSLNISAGLNATAMNSFHTGNLSLGCYNATAGASYDGKTTPEVKTDFFCIQSASEPPPGGGGGGPVAVKTPIVPPATPPSIKFVKMPVLVEVRPGATVMESILTEGFGEGNATELAVEVSGVPAGWVSVTPSAISLSPGHPEALNAVIAVPLGAWPGDYVVTIALAGEIRAESFFILRIKSYPSGYEKPSITRAVDIDRNESITRISLRVENSGRFIELFEVTEDIPKTLAPTADSITSISPEAEIVEHDPVLKWRLRDLDPYETRIISYEVSRVLDEYSPYVYWPVRQVNMFYTTKKALAEPIRIEKMSAPTLGPGKAGDISITLMNFESRPIDISARFELPAGWTIEPDRVEDVLSPRTKITLLFTVTPPSDTVPGTYVITFRVFYDGRESSKDGTVFVTQTIWGEVSGYPGALLKRSLRLFAGAIAIMFAILAALLYLKGKRKKRYKREAVSAVRNIKEKIGLE